MVAQSKCSIPLPQPPATDAMPLRPLSQQHLAFLASVIIVSASSCPSRMMLTAPAIFANGTEGEVGNGTVTMVTYSGLTLDPRSVYISLEKIYAEDFCGYTLGNVHSGTLLTLASTDLSSVRWIGSTSGWNRNASAGTLEASQSVDTFDYQDMLTVRPDAYWGMPDCQGKVTSTDMDIERKCATINQAGYFPQLAVPSNIHQLDASWVGCLPDLVGFYE